MDTQTKPREKKRHGLTLKVKSDPIRAGLRSAGTAIFKVMAKDAEWSSSDEQKLTRKAFVDSFEAVLRREEHAHFGNEPEQRTVGLLVIGSYPGVVPRYIVLTLREANAKAEAEQSGVDFGRLKWPSRSFAVMINIYQGGDIYVSMRSAGIQHKALYPQFKLPRNRLR